ncbi:MAG: hypothetical protein VYB35_05520 [Verrucomicrobiota bacterium]|nr:hypothetical protein [Verrucomicrobiota bacterium]
MGRIGQTQVLKAWLMSMRFDVDQPELQRTSRGARLVQNGSVLSEMLSKPGPTHSVFDILASAMMLSEGNRVGILGFAGGGVVSPLRAMGGRQSLLGVDLDDTGFKFFEKVSGDWRGEVKFVQSDAVKWLASQRKGFDVLLEDLSVGRDGDVFKPSVSIDLLPSLIHSKLKSSGIAIFNLLPSDNCTWTQMLQTVGKPFKYGLIITFKSFYNKVLILSSNSFTDTPKISRVIRKFLYLIQSSILNDIQVRTLQIARS